MKIPIVGFYLLKHNNTLKSVGGVLITHSGRNISCVKNVMDRELYFFVSVKYKKPVYDYHGLNTEKYEKHGSVRSGPIVLDHYPSEKEIIEIMIGEEHKCIGCSVTSYSQLSKEQYDAYL